VIWPFSLYRLLLSLYLGAFISRYGVRQHTYHHGPSTMLPIRGFYQAEEVALLIHKGSRGCDSHHTACAKDQLHVAWLNLRAYQNFVIVIATSHSRDGFMTLLMTSSGSPSLST
jgi:hypothetical protein